MTTADANGAGRQIGPATYTLEDFIAELVEEVTDCHDFDDKDSGLCHDCADDNYWQARADAYDLKLTKRQLAHLCAEALENLGLLNCVWCGVNTSEIGEFYFVNNDLWDRYGCAHGCACIGCLEMSIGRRLQPDDFTSAMRQLPDPRQYVSDRLRNRLGITDATARAPQP
jgi:hypothetical protein